MRRVQINLVEKHDQSAQEPNLVNGLVSDFIVLQPHFRVTNPERHIVQHIVSRLMVASLADFLAHPFKQ